jgi:membrane fusion protein (multidrug efflux system)
VGFAAIVRWPEAEVLSDAKDDQKQAGKGQNDETKDDDQKNDDQKPKKRNPWLIVGAIVAILLVVIGGVIYWLATAGEVTTDDAYTDGTAVSVASNVSGYATALDVTDNSYVRAGQLLLTIDPRDDEASLQQAQANAALAASQLKTAQVDLQEMLVKAPAQLQQAQAQLIQAEAQEYEMRRNFEREQTVDQRATSGSDYDQANEQLRAAEASVKQARAQVATASLIPQEIAEAQQEVQQRQAQLAQAQANLAAAQVKLSYNEIRAPQDGWITERNVDLGTYVQAGQQVFYIVSPYFWVTANFKETQLAHMRAGQHVRMTVDAYPNLVLYGHVDSIQEGSGARFTSFPAENATGNFVKIVRRVPVKIDIDSTKPSIFGLPLGISVEPTVDIR